MEQDNQAPVVTGDVPTAPTNRVNYEQEAPDNRVTYPLADAPVGDTAKGQAILPVMISKIMNSEEATPAIARGVNYNTLEARQRAAQHTVVERGVKQGLVGDLGAAQAAVEKKVGGNSYSINKAYLDTTEGFAELPEMERQEIAAAQATKEFITAAEDEEFGLNGQTMANVGGMLIPVRSSIDMVQLTNFFEDEGLIDEQSLMDVLFTRGQVLEKMNGAVAGMEPEDRAAFLQVLQKKLVEVTDNPLMRADYAELLTTSALNPDAEDLWGFLDLFVVGEAADIVRAGSWAFSKVLTKLGREASVPGIAVKTGNLEMAKVAEAAAQDEGLAKLTGATPERIAEMRDPLLTDDMAEALDTLPPGLASKLDKDTQYMDEYTDIYLDRQRAQGIIDPSDEDQVLALAELKVNQISPDVHSFEIGEVTGDTMELKMVYKDPNTGVETLDTVVQPLRFTDAGTIALNAEDWKKFRLDPNSRMTGDLNSIVKLAEKGVEEVSKAETLFRNLNKQALKGISSRGEARVMTAIQKGGEEEKVWKYGQLREEFGMSDKEAVAYFKMRHVIDNVHHPLKEDAMIKVFNANGIKFVDLGEDVGSQAVKTFDEVDSGIAAYKVEKDAPFISVQDGSAGGHKLLEIENVSQFGKADLQEYYHQGYRLVRAGGDESPIQVGKYRTRWSLVKEDAIKAPVRGKTLGRIEGYFPRATSNAHYFVKQRIKNPMDGYRGSEGVWVTRASSDGARGADKALRAMQEAGEDVELRVFRDNEQVNVVDNAKNLAAMSGGLHTGKRASKAIPFYPSVEGTERMDPDAFKMLKRMTNHSAKMVANHLRYEKMETDFLRSVSQKYNQKFNTLDAIDDYIRKAGNRIDAREKGMINDISKRIKMAKGIPTASEQAMSEHFWSLARRLENKDIPFIPNPSRLAYALSTNRISISNFLRGVAFTSYLGMWNAAQLIVQGSGMMISLAANPVHFLRGAPSMVGAAMVDVLGDNWVAQRRVLKWMRDKPGMGEFAENYELWRRSGMYDAVMAAQSDTIGTVGRGMGTSNVWRQAANSSQMFYRQGELMNSRAAFFTAAKRYASENKGFNPAKATEKDLDRIAQMAEQYKLNMGAGNASVLQETPGLNVIAQFWQIIHKFYSKVMPKALGGTDEFTKYQKARVLGFSMFAYGPESVLPGVNIEIPGLNNDYYNAALNAMGVDPLQLSEEEAVALRYGALGYFVRFGLGLNTDVTSRVAMSLDYMATVTDVLFGTEPARSFFGASGGVLDRGLSSMKLLGTAMSLTYNSEEPYTIEDLEFLSRTALAATGDLFTSTRNAQQYWSNVVEDSAVYRNVDGTFALIDAEASRTEKALAFLGMPPTGIKDRWEFEQAYFPRDTVKSFNIDKDVEIATRLVGLALATNNGTEAAHYTKMVQAIMHQHSDDTKEAMFFKWMKHVNSAEIDAASEKSRILQAYNKFLTEMNDGEAKLSVHLSKHLRPANKENDE